MHVLLELIKRNNAQVLHNGVLYTLEDLERLSEEDLTEVLSSFKFHKITLPEKVSFSLFYNATIKLDTNHVVTIDHYEGYGVVRLLVNQNVYTCVVKGDDLYTISRSDIIPALTNIVEKGDDKLDLALKTYVMLMDAIVGKQLNEALYALAHDSNVFKQEVYK